MLLSTSPSCKLTCYAYVHACQIPLLNRYSYTPLSLFLSSSFPLRETIMSSSCCSSASQSASTPSVCTLTPTDLQLRLAELASIGREGLISNNSEKGVHRLTFRSDEAIRRRLLQIVSAEAVCCSFLSLQLSDSSNQLSLTIQSKTVEGKGMADALAVAFGPGAGQQ